MKNFITKLIASFDNTGAGFSGRKLSALFAVLLAGCISLRFCDTNIVVELTIVWLAFAALCLGIVTIQQIIEFKSGNKPKEPEAEKI